jgi:uncharacterized damage-inducible protein DinB
MSTERQRIADQLRRAFERDAWHGPAVLETLQDVSAEQAHTRAIAGAHTIWELVLHLTGTYRLVLRRLRGSGSPLTPEEDWPSVPAPTEANWQESIRTLSALNAEVREAVLRLPEEKLEELLVPESPYPAYVQLIGITQHDLYHAGQISLLKRALR